MEHKKLSGQRLKNASYDSSTRVLTIEFHHGDVKIYKGVPSGVWQRFIAAPNPATYYEDRIEEEYAVTLGQRDQDADARGKLDDLFG